MDEALKQYIIFTVGNLGSFECEHMPFGLSNATATFQRLMQKCLGERNRTHCLVYLDNVIVFLKMEEEHLKHLCIVFDYKVQDLKHLQGDNANTEEGKTIL